MSDSNGLGPSCSNNRRLCGGGGSAKLLQPGLGGSSNFGPGGGGGGGSGGGSSSSNGQLQRAASSDLAGVAVLQAALLHAGMGPAMMTATVTATVASAALVGVVQMHEGLAAEVEAEAVPLRVQPTATAPLGAAQPWRQSRIGGRAA